MISFHRTAGFVSVESFKGVKLHLAYDEEDDTYYCSVDMDQDDVNIRPYGFAAGAGCWMMPFRTEEHNEWELITVKATGEE